MSLFVLVTTHTSDQCPTANAKVRQLFGADSAAEMQKLAQKLGIKPIVGPLISTQHKGFSVIEAPKVEVVRDFVLQSRLIQWNSVEVIPVITQDEALKEIAALHPIY